MRTVTKAARIRDNTGRDNRRFLASGTHYLNRDHIVTFSMSDTELTVITSLGIEIAISGSGAELNELRDDLVGSFQSNFVLIS